MIGIEPNRPKMSGTHLGRFSKPELLVVGSGITGLTIARKAAERGTKVRVVDRRSHPFGNCYDEFDDRGCLVHRYGPHIFHTASADVWEWLSRFTAWRDYEHRVLVEVKVGEEMKLLPMPVNATTLEGFFEVELPTEDDARAFLASLQAPIEHPANSEEVCLSRVGEELYEALFLPYTEKQWGRHPSELDRGVCGRIPVRTNRDVDYFGDVYQAQPAEGYSALLDRMADHPNLELHVEVDGKELIDAFGGHVVWTGQLDEAFDSKLGPLPWRSLRFETRHVETSGYAQEAPVINVPRAEVPHTRTTEFRWLTGQAGPTSAIYVEYPDAGGEPYYPVPSPDARVLAARYKALAEESDLIVCGRLGRYQYLEMGQAIGSALATYEREVAPRLTL